MTKGLAVGGDQGGGLEPLEQLVRAGHLSTRAMSTLWRRRTAMCPSAVARWVFPTPTGPSSRAPCGPRTGDLAAQHTELMAQHQEFDVFARVGPNPENQQFDQSAG